METRRTRYRNDCARSRYNASLPVLLREIRLYTASRCRDGVDCNAFRLASPSGPRDTRVKSKLGIASLHTLGSTEQSQKNTILSNRPESNAPGPMDTARGYAGHCLRGPQGPM